MRLKDWLIKTHEINEIDIVIRERVVCADGFSISVQGSRAHYCTPRRTLANGKYESLELGYPSEPEEMLDEYRDGAIYPYVPIEKVEDVIEKHGGIVWKD